jgi:hypothetical protein
MLALSEGESFSEWLFLEFPFPPLPLLYLLLAFSSLALLFSAESYFKLKGFLESIILFFFAFFALASNTSAKRISE